jgi:predicted DCC family thiol-disulfide oxidoreductase YuxK
MVGQVNDASNIIFFDGVCNLCNFWVKYVIKNDPDADFYFSSLQSDFAASFLEEKNMKHDFETIILYSEGKFITESDAVVTILNKNGGFNRFLSKLIRPIPLSIRNGLYRYIARNRFRLFGKRDRCMIPGDDVKKRFL